MPACRALSAAGPGENSRLGQRLSGCAVGRTITLKPGEKENKAVDKANQWWTDNMVDKWKK